MANGHCVICGKETKKQPQPYVSAVFCSNKHRVQYWRKKTKKETIAERDRAATDAIDDYVKQLRKHPVRLKNEYNVLPSHMPKLGIAGHYGISGKAGR